MADEDIVAAVNAVSGAVSAMQSALSALLASIDIRNEHTHQQHGHG
jgi:hypothetical protein